MDSWFNLVTHGWIDQLLHHWQLRSAFYCTDAWLSHTIIQTSSTQTKQCIIWFIVVYYLKAQEVYVNCEAFYVNINPDFSWLLYPFSPSRSGNVGRLIWSRRQRCPAEPSVLLAQSDGRNQESYSGTGFSLLFFICFLTWIQYKHCLFQNKPPKVFNRKL